MILLNKDTPKKDVELALSKLPVCPLTQEKIANPILVYTEIPGNSHRKAYFYECAPFIQYLENAIQNNKPIVTPGSLEPIVLLKTGFYLPFMSSVYEMAVKHGMVTEAFMKEWQRKVKESEAWLNMNDRGGKAYSRIKAMQLPTNETPYATVKQQLSALRTCPITQEKIVFPTEVLAETADNSYYNVHFYEAVAFVSYLDRLDSQKPMMTPDTRELIVEYFDADYLLSIMLSLYPVAVYHNLLSRQDSDEWGIKVEQTQLWLALHPLRQHHNYFDFFIKRSHQSAKGKLERLNTPHYFTDELPLAVVIRYAKSALPKPLPSGFFDYLQSLGADITKTNEMGDTLLMTAVRNGNVHFFEKLVVTLNPNAQNQRKETVLHIIVNAISDVHSALLMLKSAIDHGADPMIRDNQNRDALEVLVRTARNCLHPPSKLRLIDLCDQFFEFLRFKHPQIIFNYVKKSCYSLSIMLADMGAYPAVKSLFLAGYPVRQTHTTGNVVDNMFTLLIKIAMQNSQGFPAINELSRLFEFCYQIGGGITELWENDKQFMESFNHPIVKAIYLHFNLDVAIANKNWIAILNHLYFLHGKNNKIDNKSAEEIFTQLFQEKERSTLYALALEEIILLLYPQCDIKSFTVFEPNKMIELSLLKMIIYCNNEVALPLILKCQKTKIDTKALAEYAISLGHYHLLQHMQLSQSALKISAEVPALSPQSLFHHPSQSANAALEGASTLFSSPQ